MTNPRVPRVQCEHVRMYESHRRPVCPLNRLKSVWRHRCHWTLEAVLLGLLLGSDWYPTADDPTHEDFVRNLRGASALSIAYALASGAVFNVSNALLTKLIGLVGLAVSFPICIDAPPRSFWCSIVRA